MKVKEIIKELKKFGNDAEVYAIFKDEYSIYRIMKEEDKKTFQNKLGRKFLKNDNNKIDKGRK